MKIFFKLFYLVLFFNTTILAQPYYKWAVTPTTAAVNNTSIYGKIVKQDKDGYIYTIGIFRGTVDFDPSAGVTNLTANGTENFIQKLDKNGNLIYAVNLGKSTINDFCIGKSGAIYMVGVWTANWDADHGPGEFLLTNTNGGTVEIFIKKIDATANFIWAKSIGSIGNDYAITIALDKDESIYFSGYSNNATTFMDFDPGPGEFLLQGYNGSDIFFEKLNSNGQFNWVKVLGTENSERAEKILVDENYTIYLCGSFRNNINFNPSGTPIILTNTGASTTEDAFIAKFDSARNCIWAKSFGSVNNDFFNNLSLDVDENLVIAGTFKGTVDFDPSPTNVFNLTSVGSGFDIGVLKLTNDGNFIWAVKYGGEGIGLSSNDGDETCSGIATDIVGNVYLTGEFAYVVDFDPSPSIFNLTSANLPNGNPSIDIYIMKLNNAGNFAWANKIGAGSRETPYNLIVDNIFNFYAVGNLYGFFSTDVDFTAGTDNRSGNNYNILIEKGGECNSSSTTPFVANSNQSTTKNHLVNKVKHYIIENNVCNTLITKIKSNGTNPINGNVTAKVWIEATQPNQFVKRHYEITPETNALSATASITVYFTQQEFNDFNSVNIIKMPITPTDSTGMANIRIEKRGGTSNNGTGLPTTYTGNIETITPLPNNIFWNENAVRWEISFDVTGFSGFFVKTIATVLPLNILTFTGTHITNANQLNWITTNEVNTDYFVIERSTDGINFANIGQVNTTNSPSNSTYIFTDNNLQNDIYFYRLKIIDNDGFLKYSKTIKIINNKNQLLTISSYPVKNAVIISGLQSKGILKLLSLDGKLLHQQNINTQTITVSLQGYANGIYLVSYNNNKNIVVKKIIKH